LKWLFQTSKILLKNLISNKFKRLNVSSRRILLYFVDLIIALSFFIMLITGVFKIPGVLSRLGLLRLLSNNLTLIHDLSGIVFSIMIFSHLILHWRWLKTTTKNLWKKLTYRKLIVVSSICSVILLSSIPIVVNISFSAEEGNESIGIQLVGRFQFNPQNVNTLRPDLFKDGHFSVFDILAHLDRTNKINLKYHYRTDLDTFVIDSIDGRENWWYYAYYDGGWQENNVYRMDHYPFKSNMHITLFQKSFAGLQDIYNSFTEEINRLNNNMGKTIIPDVYISGPTTNLHFQNVVVSAHNLRNDVFQENVITAIDVIMSLGDQGLISYELKWYDSIGTAETRSYWVHSINGDVSYGTCGFVYEEGDMDFYATGETHIHIPSDTRVINSPEYVDWWWICL
jgi:hypothetical protein